MKTPGTGSDAVMGAIVKAQLAALARNAVGSKTLGKGVRVISIDLDGDGQRPELGAVLQHEFGHEQRPEPGVLHQHESGHGLLPEPAVLDQHEFGHGQRAEPGVLHQHEFGHGLLPEPAVLHQHDFGHGLLPELAALHQHEFGHGLRPDAGVLHQHEFGHNLPNDQHGSADRRTQPHDIYGHVQECIRVLQGHGAGTSAHESLRDLRPPTSFDLVPSTDRALYVQLYGGGFVDAGENILVIGDFGCGKYYMLNLISRSVTGRGKTVVTVDAESADQDVFRDKVSFDVSTSDLTEHTSHGLNAQMVDCDLLVIRGLPSPAHADEGHESLGKLLQVRAHAGRSTAIVVTAHDTNPTLIAERFPALEGRRWHLFDFNKR